MARGQGNSLLRQSANERVNLVSPKSNLVRHPSLQPSIDGYASGAACTWRVHTAECRHASFTLHSAVRVFVFYCMVLVATSRLGDSSCTC